MRSIALIRAAVLGALAGGCVQSVGAHYDLDCDVTVHGQNDPEVDAAAVSAAVNSPALSGEVTMCLAGTFDFGAPPAGPPSMSVAIAPHAAVTSLRIIGLDSGRRNHATIRRGIQALSLHQTATLPRLAIENLRFERPAFSAISILRGNEHVRISNVHIAGVATHSFTITVPPPPIPDPPPPREVTLRFRQGIAVTAALGNVDGEIEITGNVVNGGTYGAGDGMLVLGSGILISSPLNSTPTTTFSAKVRIANNRILNWAGTGILVSGLVSDATIEENRIEPGDFANLVAPEFGCRQLNGDGAASGISLGGIVNSTVRDNVITLVPALTESGAAAGCTAGLIVSGTPASGASGNVFFGNRVRGTATYAIVAGTPGTVPPFSSSEANNLFAFNGVYGFTPTAATLFVGSGATANAFIGRFPSIEDHGTSNWVINR